MKTKNRYNLGFLNYGKWQLYGSAVETVQTWSVVRFKQTV